MLRYDPLRYDPYTDSFCIQPDISQPDINQMIQSMAVVTDTPNDCVKKALDKMCNPTSAEIVEQIEALLKKKINKHGYLTMTNADRIRNMTDEELACFIREIYLHGKNEEGFEFCGYNLEAWLTKKQNRPLNQKSSL